MTTVEAAFFLADFPVNTAVNQGLSEADRHTPVPKAETSVLSRVFFASHLTTDLLKSPFCNTQAGTN